MNMSPLHRHQLCIENILWEKLHFEIHEHVYMRDIFQIVIVNRYVESYITIKHHKM